MSFMLTEAQFLDGSKDVTRRVGWRDLKPGERFLAVRKTMGLRKGEKQHVLGECVAVSVRREPLGVITADDCRREGFPEFDPAAFVLMFCRHMKCHAHQPVTRIEFRKLGDEAARHIVAVANSDCRGAWSDD